MRQSDRAIECHTAAPQKLFYWHFPNPAATAAAFRGLTNHMGDETVVSADCSASWNAEATLPVGGVESGLPACTVLLSADGAFLRHDGRRGSYLAWENESQQVIAMTADPRLLAADPYRWWKAEYPRARR